MNILEEINQNKQEEVNARLGHIQGHLLQKGQSDARVPLDFKAALQKPGLRIISEVKKASPSKGIIREDFHPVTFAKSYEAHGADCISVLTEEKYFKGHNDYLTEIRKEVRIPLLRKDFILDDRQIREAYDLGADAVLLIAASLSQTRLQELYDLATSFGLTVLVEVHDLPELKIALAIGATLIGVNNRNLITFETSLQTSLDLAKEMPSHITKVSESGIRTLEDCQLLEANGFDAILVGETLMRADDPGSLIAPLLGREQ